MEVKNPCNNAHSGAKRGARWARAVGALAVLVGAVVVTGCTGSVSGGAAVYGYPTVTAEVVPVELEAYPRVWYRGSYAYLVDGRWYYPSSAGWVVFTQEPRELYSYRVRYVPERRYYREPAYSYPRERARDRYHRDSSPREHRRHYRPR